MIQVVLTWNSTTSSFMLNHLVDMVANDKHHQVSKKYNLTCVWTLNNQFKTKYSGENVKNYLRTSQRNFSKILRLKNLSVAGWDEDSCMITLDLEHYADHINVCNFYTCCFHYCFVQLIWVLMTCFMYMLCRTTNRPKNRRK
jgi:hypothetical protein